MTDEAIIRFEHVSMQFPGVLAVDDVSLAIRPGEVFALVGENGAGKSTLMNILYGMVEPTGGEVFIRGTRVARYAPQAAIARGIGMVHQHFMLVPSFTAAQNIVLSREPRRRRLMYDFRKATAEVRVLMDTYGLTVDPQARVEDMNLGLQQRVEILKTLYRGADVLILDEPTAVLTPQEADELFTVIRRVVREQGMTVIIITHKLYEVMAVADRVGVMRAGKLVGTIDRADASERMLAEMMVGSEVVMGALARDAAAEAKAAIEVTELHALDDRGLAALRGLSLHVRPGEILGIAGIEGNGQSELAEVIAGLRRAQSGCVKIHGTDIRCKTPGEIRALGFAHIPEDRLATGVSAAADITDNLICGKQRTPRFSRWGIHLRKGAAREYAQGLYAKYDIRGAGLDVPAGSLSGGNLQKVVVAREFSFDAGALLIAQPTRGVDIGAIEFIHGLVMEKRAQGCAILLISADLDEVFRLSDRIVTIYEGRITGTFDAGAVTKAEIGLYMTGGGKERMDA